MPQHSHTSPPQTAVVIGGSISGLLAARVLSDHFEKVIIIERDDLAHVDGHRSGVPQSKHAHIFLTKGEQIITTLFKGIASELDHMGAIKFDLGEGSLLVLNGVTLPRFTAGISGRTISRIGLEAVIRHRVQSISNVEMITQAEVEHLLTTPHTDRVTGVQIRYRGDGEGPPTIACNLVVDSSGRNTKAPQWLQEMGYGETPIGRVNSFLGYASRSYRPPADLDDAWHMIGIGSSPPDRPQSAVLLKQEDGSWLVTLAGREKKYPPLDEEGFLAYSQTIDPRVHNFLQTAEPLSKIVGYQRTENMWHHYEELTRWPDGFIAVGDSVCAFNPVYGQGMTASAMDAELLQKMLTASAPHTAGWSQRFQKALAKEVKLPIWTLATGEDFRWPMTEGKQEGLSTKLSHWYVKQLIPVLPHDTEVIRTFMLVQQLLKPATYMVRPAILWRLFKFHVKNLFRSKPMKTQIVAEHVHSV